MKTVEDHPCIRPSDHISNTAQYKMVSKGSVGLDG